VILNDKTKEKPKIEYPCNWGFKLIGRDRDKIKDAIKDIINDREYECKDGNSSKSGKFVTVNTNCKVNSQEDRDKIFKAFRDHNDIDMVI
jgi:putative lipoic acid-binding regulatory protein